MELWSAWYFNDDPQFYGVFSSIENAEKAFHLDNEDADWLATLKRTVDGDTISFTDYRDKESDGELYYQIFKVTVDEYIEINI